jgi:hypothetical protein
MNVHYFFEINNIRKFKNSKQKSNSDDIDCYIFCFYHEKMLKHFILKKCLNNVMNLSVAFDQ